MSFADVGKVWGVSAFTDHLKTVDLSWARGITMHHTAAPSLKQRPEGLRISHIENIANYYRTKLGWSSGPHLFIDEDQIFGMSPLGARGVHARSFNRDHIGIEVLGDYDSEDPFNGRGLQCWETAAAAVGRILNAAGWRIEAVNFHRDDPKTGKTCPGTRVKMPWFRSLVEGATDFDREDTKEAKAENPTLRQRIAAMRWQLDQMEREL